MKKAFSLTFVLCCLFLLTSCNLFSKATSESETTEMATTFTTNHPTTSPASTAVNSTTQATTQLTTTTESTTQPTTTQATTQTTSEVYTISFDSRDGSIVEPIAQAVGSNLTEPMNPTREGYVFAGWYNSVESVELLVFDVMPSNNITLYADWATEDLVFTLINDDLEYEVSLQYDEDILSIQIPKQHDGKPVTKIADYGLRGCYSVTELVYSSNISTFGTYAFMELEALTHFTISEYITEIGSALFYGCTKLEGILVDSNNLHFKSIDGVLFNLSEEKLITYPSARLGTSYIINDNVLSIEPYAFNKSLNLIDITIGNHVTTIKSHAFFDCWSLISIVIPDQVVSIELYAFRNCVELVNVTLGSGLTGIDAYVFNRCISLHTITIPSNIEYIGYGAFYDCSSLSIVIIDKTSSQGVITGGLFMFANTPSNLAIYVPDAGTKAEYDTSYIWSSYASKIEVNPE